MRSEKEVHELTDHEVLQRTDNGRFGPAIIGEELHARSKQILRATGGGRFGPGIVGHSVAAAAAVAATPGAPGTAGTQTSPPPAPSTAEGKKIAADEALGIPAAWSHVTLSGAKLLAQKAQVSYTPRVKRHELIAALVAAAVTPPEPLTAVERAKVGG